MKKYRLLCIDAGGTELKYGIVDQDFNITNKNIIKTPDDEVEKIINSIYDIYKSFDGIDAICLSLPGFINTDNGMHMGGGCFHSLKNINIKQLVEDKCKIECLIENDGKSATIAEYYLGNLKDTINSSVFIIGTGVGGGLIINSQLFKGNNFTAGEYSYLNININDDNPRVNTLADQCSTRGLLRLYKEVSNSDQNIDGRQFFKRYYNNDKYAIDALNKFTHNVAIEILNLSILLNIERVAIGGGISAQDILIEKIKESINSLSIFNTYDETRIFIPEIVRCKYGNDANLLGVAYEYLNKKENLCH